MNCLLSRAIKTLHRRHYALPTYINFAAPHDVELRVSSEHFSGFSFDARVAPPNQVSSYSLRRDQLFYDNSSLRYFVEPEVGVDLKDGFDVFREANPQMDGAHTAPSRLDAMMEACFRSITGRESLLTADVIARESTIRRLLSWEGDCYVSYIDGKMFIEGRNVTRKLDMWGTFIGTESFLRLATTFQNRDIAKKEWDGHIEMWNPVVQRTLGGLNLLMSGQVPCVIAGKSNTPDRYVNLKCPSNPRYLEQKFQDWYVRAHLMGIQKLFLGRQDSDNVLRTGTMLESGDLLPVAQRYDRKWDIQQNYNRGFTALCMLRDYLQEAADNYEAQRKTNGKDNRVWLVHFLGGDEESRLGIRELSPVEVWALHGSGGPDALRTGLISTSLLRRLRRIVSRSMSSKK
ncbi:hypothetical protein C8J56DRAFT_149878 [Mycena floridula]|nr:hypothetical protein C8J56DRAFT_149878 [Mycena floridula]